MKQPVRKIQKAQTRKLLLETALRLFTEKGFAATRTIDIAKEAGVSHGTVFSHFPLREDLINNIIEGFGKKVAGRMHELAGNEGTLREVLEAHIAGLTETEGFYIRLISEQQYLSETARSALIGIQSAISFHINIAAEKEMKNRAIKEMPIHLLFNTWTGLIHYYLANKALFAPDEPVLKRYSGELLEHYMNLINCKEQQGDYNQHGKK